MYESEPLWRAVDQYFVEALVGDETALRAAVDSAATSGLPNHEVAPNQGKLLHLFARMIGARRILEIGTLAGYSAIWLGRAVGEDGHVTSIEIDERYAELARENITRAGLAEQVEVVTGNAIDYLEELIVGGVEPFDLVFIDADKPSNPAYLAAAMQLVHPGSVIIGDNVVRDGHVTDAASTDARVQGVRRFTELVGADPRLDATALQTVGMKGWDGFILALVR